MKPHSLSIDDQTPALREPTDLLLDNCGVGHRRPMVDATVRILGLDPGSRHTGYGVIEAGGRQPRLLGHGRISCPAGEELPARLHRIAVGVEELLETWSPDAVALESTFHGVNSRSLIVLAQARGAILVTLARQGLDVEELSPAEVKSTVAGNGRADKTQVARMVKMLLSTGEAKLTSDAADALAIALCFAAKNPLRRALARRDSAG